MSTDDDALAAFVDNEPQAHDYAYRIVTRPSLWWGILRNRVVRPSVRPVGDYRTETLGNFNFVKVFTRM